ncbi:MAG: RluA family pseudouridine synthase [Clostridiales bacterium]|nr:RluA family pseudouridine synthase [Clostridiales bacterium]
MREWTIPAEGEGKRLDRYVASNMPALKIPLLQKYLRLGRIKRNGKRAKGDERLIAGDVLALYLNDELFDAVPEKKPDPLLSKFRHNVTVLYEDESILLADKRPGLIVHPDEEEKVNTLVTHVRAYLYQKGEYDPKGGFSPAPCNRIDRFTGGIVIFAKTQEALLQMDNLIRERKLRKLYLCIVKGRMQPEEGSLENYLLKDGKRQTVVNRRMPGAQSACTLYKALAYRDGMSLVECELVTGRTHQIRVQMAHAGHPLMGDSQYGNAAWNRETERGAQALFAYKLAFPEELEGPLAKLSGRSFAVKRVPFAQKYFPEINIQG